MVIRRGPGKRRPLIWLLIPVRVLLLFVCLGAALLATGVLVAREPAIRPLEGYRIVVDAGHGGDDRGVCHFPMDLIEKEINLDIALRVAEGLREVGAEVVLTRTQDEFITLEKRAEMANEARADYLLSIHTNRIPGHPECFGAQTFFYPTSETSKRLATVLQEELLAIDPDNYRTALPGNYRVLRLSKMPGALVEIGFLTNARDRRLIATDEYRRRIIEAIVAGTARFIREEEGRPRGKPIPR